MLIIARLVAVVMSRSIATAWLTRQAILLTFRAARGLMANVNNLINAVQTLQTSIFYGFFLTRYAYGLSPQ